MDDVIYGRKPKVKEIPKWTRFNGGKGSNNLIAKGVVEMVR
jgi:hypothetical protein